MGSFVGHKGRKYWVWLAIDAQTRWIVAAHGGDRSEVGARGLGENLPHVYREQAVCDTDYGAPYTAVAAAVRHHRIGQGERGTQHIERFNNTLRQRCSRRVRQALSFSKKVENPIGAIWSFIHTYNAS
jgi:IS1 family transposase